MSAETAPQSSRNPCRARAGSSFHRRSSSPHSASCATRTGSFSSMTRSRRGGAARGAMGARELVKDPKTKEPDPDLARAIQLETMRRGLLVLTAGFYGNCVRLLPPLTTPPSLMETSLELLADAFRAVTK